MEGFLKGLRVIGIAVLAGMFVCGAFMLGFRGFRSAFAESGRTASSSPRTRTVVVTYSDRHKETIEDVVYVDDDGGFFAGGEVNTYFVYTKDAEGNDGIHRIPAKDVRSIVGRTN